MALEHEVKCVEIGPKGYEGICLDMNEGHEIKGYQATEDYLQRLGVKSSIQLIIEPFWCTYRKAGSFKKTGCLGTGPRSQETAYPDMSRLWIHGP